MRTHVRCFGAVKQQNVAAQRCGAFLFAALLS